MALLVPSKGIAGFIGMLVFVLIILVYVPATRLFLLFSIPVGIVIALILSYWHRRRPVEPEENKKPLGL